MNDFFAKHGIKYVDYKDTETLKQFLDPSGKIMPRRKTRLSAKRQREVKQAVKRARQMALLPYISP